MYIHFIYAKKLMFIFVLIIFLKIWITIVISNLDYIKFIKFHVGGHINVVFILSKPGFHANIVIKRIHVSVFETRNQYTVSRLL